MRSSATKTKNNADYDSDFTEYDNTKSKTKLYSRTPSADSSKLNDKNETQQAKKQTKSTNNRSYSSDSRTNSSRTASRSRSRSVSKSRSLSPVNNHSKQTKNKSNQKGKQLSSFKARSTDIYDKKESNTGKSSKHSDIYPRRNVYNNTKPGLARQQATRGNKPRNSIPIAPENLSQAALRVMSAQRHKNTDLQNRLAELAKELDQLRDENKTLRRVHLREEIAIKRFESHDTDINRLMRNHTDEVNALKEQIKKLKAENKRINSNLIDKEEEVRAVKKKNEEFKKILNDKKLIDSAELSKNLEQAEKELEELKTKLEVREKKLK